MQSENNSGPQPVAAGAIPPSATATASGPIAAPEANFGLGLLAGLVAAVAGAIVWALITVTTKFQIGFMAIAVGFLVAWSVRTAGKGSSTAFGVLGAGCALFGCVLGNLLSVCGFVAAQRSMSVLNVVTKVLEDPSLAGRLLQAGFREMDLVFYAIAMYEGYKLARRPGL